jgi:hypothetical protein
MHSIPQQLPTGESLVPGERVVAVGSFRRSNLAVWSRVDLAVTNRRVVGVEPHLFLGLIPTGSRTVTDPLANIASVGVNTRVFVFGFVFGVIPFTLFGLFLASFEAARPVGIVVLLLALFVFLDGFRCDITITNSGGQSIATRIAYVDRRRATAFVREIGAVLTSLDAARGSAMLHADGAAAGAGDASGTAGADPAEALSRLARLRDGGLVTAEGYAAKRAEILARL